MRILHVSAFYESHGGGIEIVAGATARALARRGHECRWAAAAFDTTPGDRITSVPLEANDPLERWTGLPMPLPSRAASRVLEQEVRAADAVIIHDALYASSLLAARYAKRHGKPWLIVQHIGAIPFRSPLKRLAIGVANRLVARLLLEGAPQVVFISDAVRRFFSGISWKRTPALLLNGVDHQLFKVAAPAERARLRAAFGMKDGRPQLLFAGRFVEKKGLPIIHAIAAGQPSWDILMAGSGPESPHEWGMPNVRCLGRMSQWELAQVYRAADALLLPSVGEGFPLVIQEAMASGLPVVCGLDSAAADPGARDLLNAVAVNPADSAGTAERFIQAIADLRGAPDAKLAAYAHSAYEWDKNARWLEDRLTDLRREATAGPVMPSRRSPHAASIPAAAPQRS